MVMFLQGRRLVKADDLASHFEVNVRTIYRDVSALSEAGVPVVGEAGVGYSLVKGYHLPPVMFTAEEALATDNFYSPTFARPTVFIDPRRVMLGVRLNLGRN